MLMKHVLIRVLNTSSSNMNPFLKNTNSGQAEPLTEREHMILNPDKTAKAGCSNLDGPMALLEFYLYIYKMCTSPFCP